MKINDKGLAIYASSRRSIDKEGYLDKKGDTVNRSYKRRWFVLKGNLLFYFEKPSEKQPVGMIILENCSVEVSDADRYSFCIRFQSNQASTRTYTLSADNDNEMERWMKSITSASFGYIDMLVKEFEKNLQRLKALDTTDSASALSVEQSHSEILLSKARPLLDCNGVSLSPIPPQRRSKNSDTNSLKEMAGIVNTISRMKTKSLTLKGSASSDSIAREKSPTSSRRTLKAATNRASAPSKEIVKNNNNILLDENENDQTTFELLHNYFGGAIWTKIGETL